MVKPILLFFLLFTVLFLTIGSIHKITSKVAVKIGMVFVQASIATMIAGLLLFFFVQVF